MPWNRSGDATPQRPGTACTRPPAAWRGRPRRDGRGRLRDAQAAHVMPRRCAKAGAGCPRLHTAGVTSTARGVRRRARRDSPAVAGDAGLLVSGQSADVVGGIGALRGVGASVQGRRGGAAGRAEPGGGRWGRRWPGRGPPRSGRDVDPAVSMTPTSAS
jgi:hypothetical protein